MPNYGYDAALTRIEELEHTVAGLQAAYDALRRTVLWQVEEQRRGQELLQELGTHAPLNTSAQELQQVRGDGEPDRDTEGGQHPERHDAEGQGDMLRVPIEDLSTAEAGGSRRGESNEVEVDADEENEVIKLSQSPSEDEGSSPQDLTMQLLGPFATTAQLLVAAQSSGTSAPESLPTPPPHSASGSDAF